MENLSNQNHYSVRACVVTHASENHCHRLLRSLEDEEWESYRIESVLFGHDGSIRAINFQCTANSMENFRPLIDEVHFLYMTTYSNDHMNRFLNLGNQNTATSKFASGLNEEEYETFLFLFAGTLFSQILRETWNAR